MKKEIIRIPASFEQAGRIKAENRAAKIALQASLSAVENEQLNEIMYERARKAFEKQ